MLLPAQGNGNATDIISFSFIIALDIISD